MKKFLLSLIILTACFFTGIVYAADITVIIDGERQNFDTEPQVINGRVMLPLREVFESVGAKVSWNEEKNEACVSKGDTFVIVKPDSAVLNINGEDVVMDISSYETDGRLLVPVRYAAEALGCRVLWNDTLDSVSIFTKGDWNCYPEGECVPVYSDVIDSARYIESKTSENGDVSYVYSTTYEDVTDYIMALQNNYGFVLYGSNLGKSGSVSHLYKNDAVFTTVTVTCGDDDSYGYIAAVSPSYSGPALNSANVSNEPEENNDITEALPPADGTAEYYENTGGTLPTYTSITGVKLSEKTREDNIDVYKYSDGFFGMTSYTMVINLYYGYSEYKTEIDFDTVTKYYTNGDKLIGIVSSFFNDEVWVLVPCE